MGGQTLYLTFDDGPDPEWTPRVLNMLETAQMKATFFAVGKHAQRHSALVRRVAAAGHRVGNHTWSHRHPLFMTQRAAKREVADGAKSLSDILGSQVEFFRPPHGHVRQCMVEEAAKHGQKLILWTLSAIDWGVLGTKQGIARRLSFAGGGDIVLMHDGRRGINRTPQLSSVLPVFLDLLKSRALQSEVLPRGDTKLMLSTSNRQDGPFSTGYQQ